jgi:ATP-dependent Lon protease
LLKDKKTHIVTLDEPLIEQWLGAPIFRRDERKFEEAVGVATGLAWTEVGGDVLDIEVTVMKGKGALTMTGQLGEVMQESAQAAMSYIRSRAKDLGLKENFYSDLDIHVHVPEGAIPKDGPSAGITMAVTLCSALTQIPVRRDVAMTGEVTLRGRVLHIGGLKEKLIAATRFGITKAIVPQSNEKDVKEFAHELDKGLKIVYVSHVDDVLREALTKNPFGRPVPRGEGSGKKKKKRAAKKRARS